MSLGGGESEVVVGDSLPPLTKKRPRTRRNCRYCNAKRFTRNMEKIFVVGGSATYSDYRCKEGNCRPNLTTNT